MRFKRNWLVSLVTLALAGFASGQGTLRLGPHFWPTPNPAFLAHGEMDGVLQPTVSGELTSGLFGCVRNNGHRFHEGIDLQPISRDRQGEALDPVFAFDSGYVRYVNLEPGKSSYGRYIVIEHPEIARGLVTLYAHLRSVPAHIVAGVTVRGGQQIAVMGRSAGGYTIPRSRAHLHFEVGFWLGGDFQSWFDEQSFGSKNDHGAYNGMNIVGIDVWQLSRALRRKEASDVWEFIMSEQVAVEAFVRSKAIPELLSINPHLMENVSLPSDHTGWRIELTWYGLPIGFKALGAAEMQGKDRWLSARAVRPDLLEGKPCMDLARSERLAAPGAKLTSLVGRMFPD